MKKIKVVQYGCGKMSKFTMRYAIEKGMEIVGAIDCSPDKIGQDIGKIMDTSNYGVKIIDTSYAEMMLLKAKPDICIITTMSLINDVKDALMLCAKLGINAITTCEEAFFPMNSSPTITKKIDSLAKLNKCTISGSGYQDACWGNLITTLCGATQKITTIKGSSSYNVEDYGIALARAHGAGMTTDQFDKEVASTDNISSTERELLIKKGNFLPSYMWNVNGWLVDKLKLTIISQDQKCVPQICTKDIHSNTLKMDIKKGMVLGMSALITTKTKENITLETECIGKVYTKDEFDKNEWTIYGEPNTTLTINKPSTVELTCATIVNRIPDVINGPNGFVPTSKLGELKYIK